MLVAVAQLHVERAIAAVFHVSIGVADDNRTQLGLGEPARHVAPQHTSIAILKHIEWSVPIVIVCSTFARDHEHHPQTALMCAHQKTAQHAVRFCLSHAVQINPRLDLIAAFGDPLGLAGLNRAGPR